MRQIRIGRRRTGPASWQQTPPPLDARDPDIVHAHQITAKPAAPGPAERGPAEGAERAARAAANRPRRPPCIQ